MTVHYWYMVKDLKRWRACFRDNDSDNSKWGEVPVERDSWRGDRGYFIRLEEHPARGGGLMVKVEIDDDNTNGTIIRVIDTYLAGLEVVQTIVKNHNHRMVKSPAILESGKEQQELWKCEDVDCEYHEWRMVK